MIRLLIAVAVVFATALPRTVFEAGDFDLLLAPKAGFLTGAETAPLAGSNGPEGCAVVDANGRVFEFLGTCEVREDGACAHDGAPCTPPFTTPQGEHPGFVCSTVSGQDRDFGCLCAG